jgi:cytochrome c-type biogenesis protein CcmH
MTIAFWATIALLIAASMFFVLPPLLRPAPVVRVGLSPMAAYRDQRAQIDAEFAQGTLSSEQHQHALQELQARVVEEVGDVTDDKPAKQGPASTLLVVAIALAIPAAALALYGVIGTPSALLPPEQQAAMAAGDAPHALSREQMDGLVAKLAQKLKDNPNDVEGWRMLARSFVAIGRLPEAVQAYEEANKLRPNDADLLADYADALALANNRSLEGKPEQLIKQALAADPKHQKSLALMGTVAFNRNDFPNAAMWWKKLLATVEPGSDAAKAIQANIAQAEAGGMPAAERVAATQAAAMPAPADNAPAAAAPGASIEGSVTLSDKVKASLPPGATLFVYARPADGSKMPLAILRAPANAFPAPFRLDDSMAMSPEARISLQKQVQIVARISKSGNAMPAAGDLTGKSGTVKVGTRDLKLVIDEIVQ